MITLELYEFKNLLMEMSEQGVANYIKKTKPVNDLISQREAYRLFSEGRVKRWIRIGMANAIRSGGAERSKKLYSMAELLANDNAERINSIINRKSICGQSNWNHST